MVTQRIVKDPDFDRIIIRTHKRAVNMTMRAKPDGLYVTVPCRIKTKDVLDTLQIYRERLIKSYSRIKYRLIDCDYTILSPCFHLYVKSGKGEHIIVKEENEEMFVYYPSSIDIYSESTQKLLRSAVIRAMKLRASVLLPPLLEMWAEKFCLSFKRVRISSARSRWGSCTSTGIISLSCYLLLLPDHLIDYVIKHELAHRKEMNHSPQFWKVLNEFTDGFAHELRKELSSYHPGIPEVNC